MPRLIRHLFINSHSPDLRNALFFEWNILLFFWNHILPDEKEHRAYCEVKKIHWAIVKDLLIDLIGRLQQLQEPQDLSVQFLQYGTQPIEQVFAALQYCWAMLRVEHRDIENEDSNWGDVLHCLREINLQCWDIQYSNYIWLHDNRIQALAHVNV